MPEIDVQELDLLGEHQDCPTSGLQLAAAVRGETLAPSAQGLELFLVQPVRQSGLLRSATLEAHSAGGIPARYLADAERRRSLLHEQPGGSRKRRRAVRTVPAPATPSWRPSR